MERYSGTQAMEEAATADPVAEWTAPSGETGLEGGINERMKERKKER